jgi:hypothetical protein
LDPQFLTTPAPNPKFSPSRPVSLFVMGAICEVVDAIRSGSWQPALEVTVRSTNGGVAVYPPKAAPDHLNRIKPEYLRPKEAAAPAAPPSSGGPCVVHRRTSAADDVKGEQGAAEEREGSGTAVVTDTSSSK